MAAPPTSGSSNGTVIPVLGILSIICLPILGPVAWIMGNNALRTADPSQTGTITAGRICGIGTVFLVIGVVWWILILAGVAHMGGLAHPTPTTP